MSPTDVPGSTKHSLLQALLAKWTRNDQKIGQNYNEIGALGKPEGLKPKLLSRLARWMDQIAFLREKEKRIIGEITAVEEKHDTMRRAKKLRPIAPEPRNVSPVEPEPEPSNPFWLWLVFLWLTGRTGPGRNNTPHNG